MTKVSDDLATISTVFITCPQKMNRRELVDFLYEIPRVSADAMLRAHEIIDDSFRNNQKITHILPHGIGTAISAVVIQEKNQQHAEQ